MYEPWVGVELYDCSPLVQHVPLAGGGTGYVVDKVLLQLSLLYEHPVGDTRGGPSDGLLSVTSLLNKSRGKEGGKRGRGRQGERKRGREGGREEAREVKGR